MKNTILQLTHEGPQRGMYTTIMEMVVSYAEFYCDAKLYRFVLDTNHDFETALYFQFSNSIPDDQADALVEALQIELMDSYDIRFHSTESNTVEA